MLLVVIFYFTLMCTCYYVYLRGGYTEKVTMTVLLVGSLLSAAAVIYFDDHWARAGHYVLLIDCVALFILVSIALKSKRFWPMWVAGFQLPGVVTHIATLVDPHIVPKSYAIAQGLWIYPMMIVLIVGTRARVQWNRRFPNNKLPR